MTFRQMTNTWRLDDWRKVKWTMLSSCVTSMSMTPPLFTAVPSFEEVRLMETNCTTRLGSWASGMRSMFNVGKHFTEKHRINTSIPADIPDGPSSQRCNSRDGKQVMLIKLVMGLWVCRSVAMPLLISDIMRDTCVHPYYYNSVMKAYWPIR